VTVILTYIESIPILSSIVEMRDDGGAVTNL